MPSVAITTNSRGVLVQHRIFINSNTKNHFWYQYIIHLHVHISPENYFPWWVIHIIYIFFNEDWRLLLYFSNQNLKGYTILCVRTVMLEEKLLKGHKWGCILILHIRYLFTLQVLFEHHLLRDSIPVPFRKNLPSSFTSKPPSCLFSPWHTQVTICNYFICLNFVSPLLEQHLN